MKIRTDFVTNSSSASFVTFKIKDKRLNKFLLDMLGVHEEEEYYIDAPIGAGGCETGMYVYMGETEITDYEYGTIEGYMESIFSALSFYLKHAGCKEIEKQENLDMLELLCDEAEDNNNYDTKHFISSSD